MCVEPLPMFVLEIKWRQEPKAGMQLIQILEKSLPVFRAASAYDGAKIVLAGSQYGTGSSRDWAAKGTYLLGVKAVIATSFERIHRSNLVGMGVLPLTFKQSESHESLGLDGTEHYSIPITDEVQPLQMITVTASKLDGTEITSEHRLDWTLLLRLNIIAMEEFYIQYYASWPKINPPN